MESRGPRHRLARVRRGLLGVLCLVLSGVVSSLPPTGTALAVDGTTADCKGPLYDALVTGLLGPLAALGIVDPPQPGWEWVDQVDPLRELQGTVEGKSQVSHTDFPASHDTHDHNFDVIVDPPFADLVADHKDDIEIEWEIGDFPEWAWPSEGDRVWVDGNWIFDCGHPDDVGGVDHFKTEIHPPRAVASMRDQMRTMPGSGTTPVRVTATDLYIHGRGGFVTDMLQCGVDVLLVNPNPVNLCFAGVEPFPHRGTAIDENFDFFVDLPAKSAGPATLAITFEDGPGNTLSPAPIIEAVPADNPTQLKVTVPLAGSGATPDDVYARRIFAGWLEPSADLHHFSVTLTDGIMHEDEDPAGSDCECQFFWINVDAAADEWTRLDGFDVPTDDNASFPCEQDDNTLDSWDDEIACGEGNLNFTGPTRDFYVGEDMPFTVKFHGYDLDCLEGLFGPPHNLFAILPGVIACYGPTEIFEPGDNDSLEAARTTFTAPGYGAGGNSAANSHYTMHFTVNDVPLTDEDDADLAAAKSCTPDPVKAGSPYTCRIEVTNNGPGLPNGVSITDTISTAVDPAEYDVDEAMVTWEGVAIPPAPTPCLVSDDHVVSCVLASVPLAPAKAVVSFEVTSLQGGTFTDTATVVTGSDDPNAGNNSASDTVTVIPQSDLRVAKTAAPSPVLAGGDLTYTVTTTNDGPSTAVNVSLVDHLPPSTEFKSAVPSSGGACSTPPVGSAGDVTCSWAGPTLRDQSRSVTIVTEVAGPGTITNTASTTSDIEDPDPSDNVTSLNTEVICTIYGTPGHDELQGTDGFDVICGLEGNDIIHAGDGPDRLFGGPGNDALHGEDGDDKLRGEDGDDRLVGGSGNDLLRGEAGDDSLHGGQGVDHLDGGLDTDTCSDPASEPGTSANCEKGSGP